MAFVMVDVVLRSIARGCVRLACFAFVIVLINWCAPTSDAGARAQCMASAQDTCTQLYEDESDKALSRLATAEIGLPSEIRYDNISHHANYMLQLNN